MAYRSIIHAVLGAGQKQLLPCCFANWSLILSVVLCCLTVFFLPIRTEPVLSSPMTGADMDVCLTSYGHCNYVSGKHACIFYDEVSAWVIFFFHYYYFYFLVCMAVGAGDAGSRLSLCGAPFVDYKVRARFYSSGGCVSIFCQTFFWSTELCQHNFSYCLWARTGHKSVLLLLMSRERKGYRHGLILSDLDVLLVKAKLCVNIKPQLEQTRELLWVPCFQMRWGSKAFIASTVFCKLFV